MTISSGSADRRAYIISFEGLELGRPVPQILYKLPGHTGAVTEVRSMRLCVCLCVQVSFHPTEKMIVSAGIDKKVIARRLK